MHTYMYMFNISRSGGIVETTGEREGGPIIDCNAMYITADVKMHIPHLPSL